MNRVLDATVERENSYVRPVCTTLEVDKVYRSSLAMNTVQGQVPNYTGERSKQLHHEFYQEVRDMVVVKVRTEEKEKQLQHVKSLVLQGNVLELLTAAQSDMTWKSYMFDLKTGTLKCLQIYPTKSCQFEEVEEIIIRLV